MMTMPVAVQLLFAHGLESGPWGRKSVSLRAAGHDVVAPDCRGLPLETRIAVLLAALRSVDPVPIVVGSSFGGLAALVAVSWAAREGLVVPGLVLCAPAIGLPIPAKWSVEIAPPRNTIVLHGRRDDVVPIDATREFLATHRHDGIELVELDDDHSLAGSIDALLAAVDRLASAARPTTSGLGRTFETLVGIVAHDLRNPLGTVQLTAELTLAAPSEGRGARHAHRILDNVARIAGVLDQAQVYAGLLGRPIGAAPHAPIDVSTAIDVAVHRLAPDDRSSVDIAIAGTPHGPWDPELLQQLLFELLDNALGYRDGDAAVQLRVDGTSTTELVVQIENAGTIASEYRTELFVPYASRRRPRNHGTRRLGLGLVLVRLWTERLGGAFELEIGDALIRAKLRLPRDA